MSVLVIAEKRSVGESIAKVLGVNRDCHGYLSGNGYLISWCNGHLLQLAPPDSYDEEVSKSTKWTLDALPILPEHWIYREPPEDAKLRQFRLLAKLMASKEVTSLVCATDAGREGELIFRLLYWHCGCKKPFKRLWISSMEDDAIRSGFAHLRDSSEFDNLYAAALCREHADWLVGMNASRYYSVQYGVTLSVGRVMSPTLAMLVDREQQIASFRRTPFWTVELDCGNFTAASQRITSKKDAEELTAACDGQTAVVSSIQLEKKSVQPPQLFDLTTIQRQANRLLGYTAQQTLDYLQSLYEKKLCTYPRTDSRFLPSEMKKEIPGLVQAVTATLPVAAGIMVPVYVERVIDDKKVTDHHALLPTRELSKADLASLPSGERQILFLVSARLLCSVGEPERYEETVARLTCAGHDFSAKGRTVLEEGWQEIHRAYSRTLRIPAPKETTLPPLKEGQKILVSAALHKGMSTPPKHHTEDTLLAAMENAGSEDFAKIEDPERKGLGTPATRAATIEKLTDKKLVVREKPEKGKTAYLLPTKLGTLLIGVLSEELRSAKLTAEWEAKLKQIALGSGNPKEFMHGIQKMTRRLVANRERPKENPFPQKSTNKEPVGPCPWCGKPVIEIGKGFVCSGFRDTPSCRFALWRDNGFFKAIRKELSRPVAEALLKQGKVKLQGLYSQKTGRTYNAMVVLSEDKDNRGDRRIHFSLEFPERGRSR